MSKVLIVSATPRKNGNSQLLADEFARGAREAGHTVEAFALRDLELKFCIGCLACQRTGKCVLSDSVNALLPKVQEADVLVFATPVYYYGLSGQLKTFLDRLNPLFGRQNAFKRVYLLVAAADGDESAFDGPVTGMQGWVDCFPGVEIAGVVRGAGVNDAGEIRGTQYPQAAYLMGKSL